MNNDPIYVYACGIAYEHEMDATPVNVYHSVERLKKEHPHWEQCGIVRLKVELDEWVVEQKLEIV